jgi:mannose PTS system EIID component
LKLTRLDLWRMFARSLFFQTLWNFQRMQNVGWAFAFQPALRRLRPSAEARRPLAGEQLEYFNTHPYLAGLILGVVAGMEEEGARREQVQAAKKSMSGPLAALGDTVFWATLRPLAAVLAVAVGLAAGPDSGWVVPALFLALYNLLHLPARAGGLALGYRMRSDVIRVLMRLNVQRVVRGAYLLGAGVSLGAIAGLWATFGPGAAAAALMVAFALVLLRAGFSATQVFYAVTAGAAGFTLLVDFL